MAWGSASRKIKAAGAGSGGWSRVHCPEHCNRCPCGNMAAVRKDRHRQMPLIALDFSPNQKQFHT